MFALQMFTCSIYACTRCQVVCDWLQGMTWVLLACVSLSHCPSASTLGVRIVHSTYYIKHTIVRNSFVQIYTAMIVYLQIYLLLRTDRDNLVYSRNQAAFKFTANTKKVIEEQLQNDDEMTGVELQKLLAKGDACMAVPTAWGGELTWNGHPKEWATVRWLGKEIKRLKRMRENKDLPFEDVIYTDEITLQIETHWQTCCYKEDNS